MNVICRIYVGLFWTMNSLQQQQNCNEEKSEIFYKTMLLFILFVLFIVAIYLHFATVACDNANG